MIIDDKRKDKKNPWAYVVALDTFMSGWGKAPGRSLFALAVDNQKEADIVIENLDNRGDMVYPRVVTELDEQGRPCIVLHNGDHLSIRDREEASRHYTPGGFE